MSLLRMTAEVEQQWRERFSRWRRGGMSVASFCDSEGVSESSFYAWRRRLERQEQDTSKLEFVELRGVLTGSAAPIVVEVAGVVVKVPPGFSSEDLARLLAVIEARQ